MADLGCVCLRDVPLALNLSICAVILNTKSPKRSGSHLTGTPVFPTFFRLSVLDSEPRHHAQPCTGHRGLGTPGPGPWPHGAPGVMPGFRREGEDLLPLRCPYCTSACPPPSSTAEAITDGAQTACARLLCP